MSGIMPLKNNNGQIVSTDFRNTDEFLDTRQRLLDCVNCERAFDPITSRWLCPHCKFKNGCCEGEPL